MIINLQLSGGKTNEKVTGCTHSSTYDGHMLLISIGKRYRCSLKVGYNLASSSESKVIITGEAPNVTITTPATGGGGLSITANVNANIMDNLGVSASVTGDYMSKKIESDQPEQRVAVTPTLVESFKKWTLSGDLLVNYSFINSIEGLNAGIQGGVNFVSTNVGDAI